MENCNFTFLQHALEIITKENISRNIFSIETRTTDMFIEQQHQNHISQS